MKMHVPVMTERTRQTLVGWGKIVGGMIAQAQSVAIWDWHAYLGLAGVFLTGFIGVYGKNPNDAVNKPDPAAPVPAPPDAS